MLRVDGVLQFDCEYGLLGITFGGLCDVHRNLLRALQKSGTPEKKTKILSRCCSVSEVLTGPESDLSIGSDHSVL